MKKKSKRWKGSTASRISDDRRYIESVYQKYKDQIERGYSEYQEGSLSGGTALNTQPNAKNAFVNEMMNKLHPELATISGNQSLTKMEKISQIAEAKRKRTGAKFRKSVANEVLGSKRFSTWESTEGRDILERMKFHKVYDEFRNLIGKTKKIDFSKLQRVEGTSVYRYDYQRREFNEETKKYETVNKTLGIKFETSPEVIRIITL